MRLGEDQCRDRFGASRVARLATLDSDGAPHLVPVTFVLDGDDLFFAVDHKPKSTTELARLRNLRHDPRVSLLADHYADDWERLWWVRADGVGRQVDGLEHDAALHGLVAKYPQYREVRPGGPVVGVRLSRWTGWSARA